MPKAYIITRNICGKIWWINFIKSLLCDNKFLTFIGEVTNFTHFWSLHYRRYTKIPPIYIYSYIFIYYLKNYLTHTIYVIYIYYIHRYLQQEKTDYIFWFKIKISLSLCFIFIKAFKQSNTSIIQSSWHHLITWK